MKAVILTGFDAAFQPIGELTAPLMLQYANRHGFDFSCRHDSQGMASNWIPCLAVLEAFRNGYDRALWMEADIVVTNPDFEPPWEQGLHLSLDWGSDAADESFFSTCAFCACLDSMGIFQWLLNHESEWRDKEFPFQEPMRSYYRHNREGFVIHDRRIFNAVPQEIGGVMTPWESGDWLCHLTHIPLDERVRLFHEITGK